MGLGAGRGQGEGAGDGEIGKQAAGPEFSKGVRQPERAAANLLFG